MVGPLYSVYTLQNDSAFANNISCIQIILISLTCASAWDLFYPIKWTTFFGMENIYTKWNITHSFNWSNEQRSKQNGQMKHTKYWVAARNREFQFVSMSKLANGFIFNFRCTQYSDSDIHTLKPPQHQLRKFIKCYWQWYNVMAFSNMITLEFGVCSVVLYMCRFNIFALRVCAQNQQIQKSNREIKKMNTETNTTH